MSVESTRAERAAMHAALGEPGRLAIVDALAMTDASPTELGRALGMSSNLVAHHLGVLEAAGIIVRGRSEADRRRTYVQLSPSGIGFAAASTPQRVPRVVFVCTQNSARSQLAAALWASRADLPVASAGTRPARRVHPRAVSTARRHGLEMRRAKTAHVRDVVRSGDLVVAVCDHAYEELAETGAAQLHWSIPDPVLSTATDAFDCAFDRLDYRVRRLVATIDKEKAQ